MSDRQGIATIRLHPGHRLATYLTLAVIAASGLAWTIMVDWLDLGPGPWPLLLLKIHGISSFLTMMVIGSVMPTHMRLAWRHRRNVVSGVLSSLVLLIVAATAAGLYYGSEELREVTRWTHIIVGTAIVLMLPLHVVLGRRQRQRQQVRPHLS